MLGEGSQPIEFVGTVKEFVACFAKPCLSSQVSQDFSVLRYSSASVGGGKPLIMSIPPISGSSRDNIPEAVEFQLPVYVGFANINAQNRSRCAAGPSQKVDLALDPRDLCQGLAKIHLRMTRIVPQGTNTSQRRSRCAGHVVLCDGDPAIMVNVGDRTMAKLVVLSASRSAIADAQAHQKDQYKRAHPECGIGVIVSLSETGSATARLRERSASRVRRTRLQQPGVGDQPTAADKFVGLTMVPCGGMPHN